MTSDELLAQDMGRFYLDPLGFVMYAFPWATDVTIQQVELTPEYQKKYGLKHGPDEWAIDFLDTLQEQLYKKKYPIQFSTASGHGIGKTTLVAWLILWIMSTRPLAKGVVTAGTIEQLRSKTWSELKKWLDICITGHWFTYSSGRGNLALRAASNPEGWNCIAQTAKEENSESFAGLHAAASTPFYIFDEASQIPAKIFEVRNWGITDGEAMTFDFGNPTRNSGEFYENTAGRLKHRYITKAIDSRSVSITNKEKIEQEIADYGEDSDRIKVRVRGMFPSIGSRQLIGNDDVQEAMDRPDVPDRMLNKPLVLGVDVAAFGLDKTVIYPRMDFDARSFEPVVLTGQDPTQVTGAVINVFHKFETLGKRPVAIFVDANGLGLGVWSNLLHLGYPSIKVYQAHKALDPNQYRSKNEEMWVDMKQSILDGLRLPSRETAIGAELFSQLTQREYDYTLKGQIALESKEDMKDRGLESPDIADALALTFYQKTFPQNNFGTPNRMSYKIEYDIFGDINGRSVFDNVHGDNYNHSNWRIM